MKPFEAFSGVAAPLPRINVNTDAIIPGSYLRSVNADLVEGLFSEWRYNSDRSPAESFILNRKPYDKAQILFAGENFGCGSSREAAVWALQRFGFRAIFSIKFADIFYENAQRNGLLLGLVTAETIEELSTLSLEADPQFHVDLERCEIAHRAGKSWAFAISQSRQKALLNGDDEIALTLAKSDDIAAFHAADRKSRPWSYRSVEVTDQSDGWPNHNQ